jgi:hypothetical protein
MFRRSVLALASLLAVTALVAAPAAAAGATNPQSYDLTPREVAGLHTAGKVLRTILGGILSQGGH